MKIRLLCVGKMKSAPLRTLVEDYAGRIQHFANLEVVEIRDGRSTDAVVRLREEAEEILHLLGKKSAVAFPNAVLWDERGKTLDTKEFSAFLDKASAIDFVIGSSHGVAASLKEAIPKHLRLSSMTLTHEWARALALEQIYRAFCVLRKFPYHH